VVEDQQERPSDISDQATQREEQFLEAALKQARNVVTLKATGSCLYCEEPVGEGVRFCDAACRDGHEHEARMRKINGQ